MQYIKQQPKISYENDSIPKVSVDALVELLHGRLDIFYVSVYETSRTISLYTKSKVVVNLEGKIAEARSLGFHDLSIYSHKKGLMFDFSYGVTD